MKRFPIFRRHHLNRVPGAAIEEGAVGTFAGALLAANTKIRIDFDAAKGRMVLIRHPEHAALDRAILDARGRSRATGAAICRDGKNTRLLLARGLPIADRHGPMFVYDVEHALLRGALFLDEIISADTIT